MSDLTRAQSTAAWEHHSQALDQISLLTTHVHYGPSEVGGCALTPTGPARQIPATTEAPPGVTLSAPVDRWEAMLHSAVAELRLALDELVWSYAADLTQAQRHLLRFPIVASYSRWQSAALRHLPGVPEPIRDRIRDVQPFTRAEHEQLQHPLVLLDHLSSQAAPAAARPAELSEPLHLLWLTPDPLPTAPTGHGVSQRLALDTPAGSAPALPTLGNLLVNVALILAHVGGETGRPVPAVQAMAS